MRYRLPQLLAFTLLWSFACSQQTQAPPPDPPDQQPAEETSSTAPQDVTSFIETELLARYGEYGGELRYLDGATDLDGDGEAELLVHAIGPMVCGSGGCSTLVFTPEGDGYRLVAEIGPGRTPIQALDRTSNGWRNLLVHVSGGGVVEGYEAELQFDGSGYPSNPTVPPALEAEDTEGAEVVIADFENLTDARLVVSPAPVEAAETEPAEIEAAESGDAEAAETAVDSELAGTAWRLVQIQSMDDTTHTPSDRTLYTLEFGADGTASVQADCNRASGSWSSESSGQLAFGLMAATQAMCGPGSLHDVYLRQFEWVRSYVLRDGHLFLATMADGSIIEFEPVAD